VVLQAKDLLIPLLLLLIFTTGCGKDKVSTVTLNPEEIPDIHTEFVNSLISDSGITRYRMEAEVWDIFSSASEPYWYFPRGIYLEQFDSLFNVVGSIEADTAYYFENRELWQLIGNVFIQNLEGHTFETSELFWNQREPADSENAVYTDKPVRIDQGDNITVSKGLRANQRMTKVRMMEVGADIWVKDEAMTPTTTDTVAPAPRTPPPPPPREAPQETTRTKRELPVEMREKIAPE